MLLIDAVYIHESGGKVLFEYLVAELKKEGRSLYLLLDKRLESKAANMIAGVRFFFIERGERSRKKFYRKLPQDIDTVFCFANVPPPIPLRNIRVFVFMQNVLLLTSFADRNLYPVLDKIKFILKKYYIRFLNKQTYQWVVQTPSMKVKLRNAIGVLQSQIHTIPFFPEPSTPVSPGIHDRTKFIYVADGVPQKNHDTLLDAWLILKEKYQLTPELHLTVPERFEIIVKKINALNLMGLKIINHGFCTSEKLAGLYLECKFLVFPSLVESFGLPLIEAAAHGCVVIAPNLPYVLDVVCPVISFDPLSSEDIAKKVSNTFTTSDIAYSGIICKNEIDKLVNLLNNGYISKYDN